MDSAQADEIRNAAQSIHGTAEYLRDELTNVLKRNPALGKFGLEVAIIGLGVSPGGVRRPAIACITNCSSPVPKRNGFARVDLDGRPFERYVLDNDRPAGIRDFVGVYGATGGSEFAINGFIKKIQKRLRRLEPNADPRPILDGMVAALRLHRAAPQLSKVIGSHCVGAAVASDYKAICVSYGERGGRLLFPNFVPSKV